MKTIKELEAELNNYTMGSPEYLIIIGKIAQANHVLRLIDSDELILYVDSKRGIVKIDREELKKRING